MSFEALALAKTLQCHLCVPLFIRSSIHSFSKSSVSTQGTISSEQGMHGIALGALGLPRRQRNMAKTQIHRMISMYAETDKEAGGFRKGGRTCLNLP